MYDWETLFIVVVSSMLAVLCSCVGLSLFAVFLLGVWLLWRRREPITANSAIRTGAERVSRAFRRTHRGLEPIDVEPEE